MGLGLGAVDQGEIAEITAAADIDVERDRLAMHNSLERDQLRPREEMLVGGGGGAQFLGHFRIARAGLVANAGDHAARGLLAQAADQLFAKGAQRAHVHQHHPLVVEPDAALFRCEAEAIGEVVNFGNANGATGGALGHRGGASRRDGFQHRPFQQIGAHSCRPPIVLPSSVNPESAIVARQASLVFPQGGAEAATDLVTGGCVELSAADHATTGSPGAAIGNSSDELGHSANDHCPSIAAGNRSRRPSSGQRHRLSSN